MYAEKNSAAFIVRTNQHNKSLELGQKGLSR